MSARPYIGGQAVLEGVMMRSPKSFVVAVRRPDGSIAVREQEWRTLLPSLKFLRWPLFRGGVVLLESMHNGFSALNFSAEQAMPVTGERAPGTKKSAGESAMLAFATFVAMLLFIAAPHYLTLQLGKWIGGVTPSTLAFQAIDGVIRLGILLGYIVGVSRTPEMKRVFEYHGAEHKAIWAYESQKPLTVENAQAFTTLHPRCGTSFLFVVIFVAVLVHMLVLPLVPQLSSIGLVQQGLLVLLKIALAFPIAGVAYELQRVSARPSCPVWLTWLTRPGMWMQNITTRPPSAEQLEIALIALERALAREEGRAHVPDGVNVYPSFQVAIAT